MYKTDEGKGERCDEGTGKSCDEDGTGNEKGLDSGALENAIQQSGGRGARTRVATRLRAVT